jgi:Fe2+ transport system protein FeoA
MKTTLCDLKQGESATVVTVLADFDLRQRLLEMGFTPGTKVDVIRYAPLLDPVEYRLKGYNISLRRTEACQVVVAPLTKVAPPPVKPVQRNNNIFPVQ